MWGIACLKKKIGFDGSALCEGIDISKKNWNFDIYQYCFYMVPVYRNRVNAFCSSISRTPEGSAHGSLCVCWIHPIVSRSMQCPEVSDYIRIAFFRYRSSISNIFRYPSLILALSFDVRYTSLNVPLGAGVLQGQRVHVERADVLPGRRSWAPRRATVVPSERVSLERAHLLPRRREREFR